MDSTGKFSFSSLPFVTAFSISDMVKSMGSIIPAVSARSAPFASGFIFGSLSLSPSERGFSLL